MSSATLSSIGVFFMCSRGCSKQFLTWTPAQSAEFPPGLVDPTELLLGWGEDVVDGDVDRDALESDGVL